MLRGNRPRVAARANGANAIALNDSDRRRAAGVQVFDRFLFGAFASMAAIDSISG